MTFRRILMVALAAGVIMSNVFVAASADSTGWQGSNEDGWRYYTSSSEYLKDTWKSINGNWYYFMEDGHILFDCWAYIDSKLYHFDSNGHMEKNKWISCGEIEIPDENTLYSNERVILNPEYQGKLDWRYVGADGAAYVGWNNIGGSWYHFSENKNWYKDRRMGRYGLMDYGWYVDDDGSSYCFDENGKMMTNTWYDQGDNIWFYFGTDGRAYTGWHKVGGKWYWFNVWYDNDEYDLNISRGATNVYDGNGIYGICVFSDTGELLYGWQRINGKWYYSGSNGYAYTNRWLDYCGKKYYFNDIGEMVANQKEYYIEGKLYNFDANGVCSNYTSAQQINGWHQVKGNAIPHNVYEDMEFWVYVDSNGKEYRNKWLNYKGAWYYFYQEGFMASSIATVIYNDKIYEFDEKGQCLNFDQDYRGWRSFKNSDGNESWYYYGEDGKVSKKWKNINNKWYYFSEYSGSMLDKGMWILEDEKTYAFDSNGVLVTGWHKNEDTDVWSYSFPDGYLAEDGWQQIGGKWYYFYGLTPVSACEYYLVDDKYYDFDKSGVCLNPDSGRPLEVIVLEK